jgi:hypothetical protein
MKSAPGLSRLMQRKSSRLGNAVVSAHHVFSSPRIQGIFREAGGRDANSLRLDLIAVFFFLCISQRPVPTQAMTILFVPILVLPPSWWVFQGYGAANMHWCVAPCWNIASSSSQLGLSAERTPLPGLLELHEYPSRLKREVIMSQRTRV